MKRFAAHYLFVPGSGFLKQYAIEIEGGYICHIFPFCEEIESVEWFPGVILLTSQEESDINTLFNFTNIEKQSIYIPKVTIDMKCRAYLLYPFKDKLIRFFFISTPITLTSTISPTLTASRGCLINLSVISEMCTRPS